MSRYYLVCNSGTCRRRFSIDDEMEKYEVAIHYLRRHCEDRSSPDHIIPPVDVVIANHFTKVSSGKGRY